MRIKAMNGTEVDVTPEEIKKHAMEMGMVHNHNMHMPSNEYWDKAKHNIAMLINHKHEIETEEDAKEILAHCLELSPKQADLLYEIVEFAIGMAK